MQVPAMQMYGSARRQQGQEVFRRRAEHTVAMNVEHSTPQREHHELTEKQLCWCMNLLQAASQLGFVTGGASDGRGAHVCTKLSVSSILR